MTKTDLVNVVADKTGMKKKEAEAVVNATFDAIIDALDNGDKVQLIGFGTFESKDTPEKEGRNLKTGETITIPAGKRVSFKASKNLKNAVNG